MYDVVPVVPTSVLDTAWIILGFRYTYIDKINKNSFLFSYNINQVGL
jgi:hypothetical protein